MKPSTRSGLLSLGLTAVAALSLCPAGAEAEVSGPPTLSADLREEYLTGEPMLVRLEARNDSGAAITMPDLGARFELVRFELKLPNGQTQNRVSRPDAESAQTWSLPPRGVREVLLELPASSTLAPGDYKLAVHVRLSDTDERTLPPRDLRLAQPNPVAADLSASAQPSERTADLIPWVHKGAGGYDLYLFRAENSAPNVRLAQDHLARVAAPITPTLTAARSGEPAGRFLVWQEGDRRLRYAALQDHRLDGAPQTLDVPWPKVALAAQGLTTPDGTLLQPIWIPAPSGDAGELRVASVGARGSAAYRRVGRYDRRPELVRSLIDDAGSVHLLVVHGSNVDLYSVKAGADLEVAAKEGLPLGGRRLYTAPSDVPLVDARFATLDRSDSFAGGMALMVLERTTPTVLTPRWLTLGGAALSLPDVGTLRLPDGARLIDLSPAGSGQVGALMRLGAGELR